MRADAIHVEPLVALLEKQDGAQSTDAIPVEPMAARLEKQDGAHTTPKNNKQTNKQTRMQIQTCHYNISSVTLTKSWSAPAVYALGVD